MSQQQTKKQTGGAKKQTGGAAKKQSGSAKQQAAAKGASQPQDRQTNGSSGGDAIWRLTFHGKTYEVGEGDLTPREVRAFRRETGMSFAAAMDAPDIDCFAVLLWLLESRDDPQADLDWYLDELTYADFRDMIDDEAQAQ